MMIRRPSRRRSLRRRAAEIALDEAFAATAAEATATPELAAEIDAMRGIGRQLARIPASDWPAATERPPAALTRRRGRIRTAPAIAAALACLVLAFLAGSLIHPTAGSTGQSAIHGRRVVLQPLAGEQGTAVAYVKGAERIVLRIEHLPPSPPGTYYELWLMTTTTDLVPVAGFRIAGSGRADLTLGLPDWPVNYRYLDISLQRVGAGTAISPISVLRGPLE